MLEVRAQHGVLQPPLDLIDDLMGGLKRSLGQLPLISFSLELTQGEVDRPKLGRVADGVGGGQGLPKRRLRLLPLAAG